MGRDASTVLVATSRTRSFCPVPTSRITSPLCCELLTTLKHRPVYHGGGLLPSGFSPHTLVATPTVYKPPTITWGVRPLSPKEFLEAQDLPSSLISPLLESGFTNWDLLVPLGCLQAAFCLFAAVPSHSDSTTEYNDGGGWIASGCQTPEGS